MTIMMMFVTALLLVFCAQAIRADEASHSYETSEKVSFLCFEAWFGDAALGSFLETVGCLSWWRKKLCVLLVQLVVCCVDRRASNFIRIRQLTLFVSICDYIFMLGGSVVE